MGRTEYRGNDCPQGTRVSQALGTTLLSRSPRWLNAAVAVALLAAAPVAIATAQTPCAGLAKLAIPASAIGLPSRGATILSAEVVAATSPGSGANAAPPAAPEYCKVLGTLAPIDSSASLINFELNLPTRWNGKAVQYGGGGFNGVLITGLGTGPDAAPGAPTPLARGYVTYGTDSGHQSASLPEMQAFALNDEALVNFAYASYKKVRDVAVDVMRRRYGRAPSRIYFAGTSEGGREGLAMAQRFPRDFDGVVSRVPVINWTGLQHAGNRTGVRQQNGGWLNPARVGLIARAVLSTCDSLDGLADGIVSNYMGCRSAFHVESLRCPQGTDTGDACLSDQQVAAMQTLHSPYEFPFALANGVRAYPGWAYGGEQPGDFPMWVAGSSVATFTTPPNQSGGMEWSFGNAAMRYFIMRDARANPLDYSPNAYAERVRQISALMDATDPDLSAFAKHGGKLIVKEHMGDFAQSPFAGAEYYESVVRRMGAKAVDRFMRLYVTPGVGHGGRGTSATTHEAIPSYVDLLQVLDDWVEHGRAPGGLTQTSVATTPPFAVVASRPMCTYPEYPRYGGSGDPTLAASFVCSR